MDSSSLIEAGSTLIWLAAAFFGGLSLLFVAAILGISGWHYREAKRNSELDDQWSAWLLSCTFFPTPAPNSPYRRQQAYLAAKWVKLLLSYTGEHKDFLREKALESWLPDYVTRVVTGKQSASTQALEACVTLIGLLKQESLLTAAYALLKSSVAPVAFAAAVALVRLDKRFFLKVWSLLPLQKLSKSVLLTLLAEGSPAEVDQAMRRRIASSTPKDAAQLLSAWDLIPGCSAREYATGLLVAGQEETWLLSAALRLQSNPKTLPLVRKYLDHDNWGVRLNAVKALGAMGYGDDANSLQRLQNNPNWWVRIRAKEQLTELSHANA